MNTVIYSIDLGTSRTRLLIAEIDDQQVFGLKVLYSEEKASRGMKRGQVFFPDETSRVITELTLGAKKKLGKKYDSEDKYKKVYCINVNGVQFSADFKSATVDTSRKIRIDESDVKHAMDIIRNELNARPDEITLNITPADFHVDNLPVTSPISISGQSLMCSCFAVTTAKKNIMTYNCLLPMVKFDQFCTPASAKARVLIPPRARKNTIALVDVGASTINVAIVKNDAPRFESMIPIGADLITSDIENELEVSHGEAEVLKQNVGTLINQGTQIDVSFTDERTISINTKQLKLIILARVEELAAYIGKLIGKSSMLNSIDLFIITGGGAESYGLIDSLKKVFDGKSVVALEQTNYDGIDNEHLLRYCACYGMAITYVKNNPVIEPEIQFSEAQPATAPVDVAPEKAEVKPAPQPQKDAKKGNILVNLGKKWDSFQDWALGKEPSSDNDDLE